MAAAFGIVLLKQKTAYEIKECDLSSDVCSSDLSGPRRASGWKPPSDWEQPGHSSSTGFPPQVSRGRQVLPPLHRCKLANSFASFNAVSGWGTARAELAGQLKRPRQLERRWTGHCVQVDTGLRCRTRAGSLASRRRSRQHGRRRGTGGSHMKLRLSIDTILLAAVLLAAVPVGSLHAAEAPRDTASADVPHLIDPSSPPPSERQAGTTAPPVAPPAAPATTPAATPL